MSKRTIGFVLIVLGVIILAVSLAADTLGLGAQMEFGWKQMLGTAIGIIFVLVGVWQALRKPKPIN
jgi:uncharacterized membrane protein